MRILTELNQFRIINILGRNSKAYFEIVRTEERCAQWTCEFGYLSEHVIMMLIYSLILTSSTSIMLTNHFFGQCFSYKFSHLTII